MAVCLAAYYSSLVVYTSKASRDEHPLQWVEVDEPSLLEGRVELHQSDHVSNNGRSFDRRFIYR